jgi:hypothetical protein
MNSPPFIKTGRGGWGREDRGRVEVVEGGEGWKEEGREDRARARTTL